MEFYPKPNPESPGIELNNDFEVAPGRKGKDDFVLLYRGSAIRFLDLAQAVAFLYNNEERIWPPSRGFMGGEYLRKLLNECMDKGAVTLDMLRRYRLR